MATENLYSPEVIELTGGLDFTTAKPSAGRGTLSDGLNVEVATRKGYSRIGGYERTDGNDYTPSMIYTNLVLIRVNFTISTNFGVGEILRNDDPAYKYANKDIGVFKGLVTKLGVVYQAVLVGNYAAYLSLVTTSSTIVGATSASEATFLSGQAFTSTDASAQIDELNNNYFYTTNRNTTAPNINDSNNSKNNPITGLKLYKDRFYAITDFQVYDFTAGTVEPFSGDIADYSANTLRVIDYRLTSGAWSTGDAAGQILVKKLSGNSAGTFRVRRGGVLVNSFTTNNSLVSNVPSWAAGLFRTIKGGGWEEVNTGYELTFNGGTSNGPPPLYSRGNSNSIVLPVAGVSVPGTVVATAGGWVNGATPGSNILAADAVYATRSTTLFTDNKFLQPSNFSSAIGIPADSTITGVSFKIKAKASVVPPTAQPYLVAQLFNSGGVFGEVKATPILSTTNTEYILGGPDDVWTVSDLKSKLDSTFGLNIVARHGMAPSGVHSIDYVELTVYYTASVSTFYFYNGTDDVIAPITNYFVDSGDWATNNAHGFMQVASVVPYGAATRTYITAGDQIRTGAGGTGALIANVESNAIYTSLPSLAALEENNSRYELIVANFYGNKDWEAIYGVSGAGRGFSYDGYYLRRLYTGLSSTIDKPRHVAFNQHALALGYDSGNVTLSVQGQPENYSGIDGAVSFDVGDPVTGLLRMNGTTLGVFCKSSISGLTGTSIDNYSLMVLSPNEGAIEYTVVDMGKPVYCSNKGISLFDQTAAYGSFLGNRLSALVSPWLLPRLQNRAVPVSFAGQSSPAGGATGLLFAAIVRSKNQYRLYFADGVCLTMTLFGVEQQPMFTLQQYDKWTMPEVRTTAVAYTKFLPLAYSSDIDSLGKERIVMSHYDGIRDVYNNEKVYYAYEFEDSWSFDGFPIPCSATLNDNFYGTPFDFDVMRKFRVHGTSRGYAPLKIEVTANYNDPKNAAPVSQNINLPRDPRATILHDQEPQTNMATMGKWGRSFSARLFYDRTSTSQVYPPFTVQVLQIQNVNAKGDV